MSLTVKSVAGDAGRFTGSLVRPQHFTVSGSGASFSGIRGPSAHYIVTRTRLSGSCLRFTAEKPEEESDRDNFRLCIADDGRATLGFDIPSVEPWPVTKAKEPVAIATDWDSTRTYFVGDTGVSNSEMRRVYEADQKDRQSSIGRIDWKVVGKRDAARRALVRKLLANGELHTGRDFERAAIVFQHGGTPDDYLLAHTLAMVAMARGQGGAIWIAAASLDRYLNAVHQPQIYGTQFNIEPNGHVTQKPYNRTLISDALRRDLNVPSLAAQKNQQKQYEKQLSKH